MTNYFPHDSNARADEKLINLRIRHKAAGYGVYWMLLEIMRDKKDFMLRKDYNAIAFDLREDASLIKAVVEDFGLFVFTDDGKYFYSESFRQRMQRMIESAERKKAAAQKAANTRWSKVKGDNDEDKEIEDGQADDEPEKELSLDDIGKLMKESELWIAMMCQKYKLDNNVLVGHIDNFILDCKCRDKKHDSVKDAKRHFNDWLRIILKTDKKKPKRTPEKPAKELHMPTKEDVEKENLRRDEQERERFVGYCRAAETNPESSAAKIAIAAYNNGTLARLNINWKPPS